MDQNGLKKLLLKDTRLYLVLDADVLSHSQLFEVLQKAVTGGVDIVQLRDKAGKDEDIIAFSRRAVTYLKGSIPFIVNDRVDLAIAGNAQGVHLGQKDASVLQARASIGPQAIIGASCQTLEQALQAQEEGADYIGFGSVFKTLTKPERLPMDQDLLVEVIKRVNIPVFAIGGIDLDNIAQLTQQGVHRFAVTRAICCAGDVEQATKQFCESMAYDKCVSSRG